MKPASPIARLISRLNEMLRSVERAGARSARRRDLCRIDTLFAAERLEDRTLLTAPEFAEVGTYLGLSTPLWSSSGDFNEDGFEDLVVSAYASSTLNVYFNLGNGSFNSSPLVLPTAAGHTNLHVADINGDSHLDIIAGHTASGGVSVRLGNGAGNFGAHTFFPTGAWVHAIDVADINGDGNQDIVSVNYNAQTISVLAGNGNGGFTEVNEFAGTTGMSSVRIADFNQDGKLDLVTSDSVVNLISVRFGNGDSTFSAATNYSTSAYPYKLQVFDADRDGILDIFCAEYVGDRVSYLRGLPGGTFAAPVGLPGSGTMDGADELRVGDVNNDGFEDLVVNELNTGRTRMLLGHGDGTFELSTTILSSGPNPRGGVLADLNNDGNLDWAAVSETSGSMKVFLQKGKGSVSGKLFNDINGDGLQNGGEGGLSGWTVFEDSNNNGIFDNAEASTISDVNGNYELNGVVEGPSAIRVVVQNGWLATYPEVFGDRIDLPLANTDGRAVTSGDFDGDGREDLAVAGGSKLSIYSNSGGGGLNSATDYSVTAQPRDLTAADLDGDGDQDLVSANYNAGSITVFRNDNGSFNQPVVYSTGGAGTTGVVVADFDGNGSPEIVVIDNLTDRIHVFSQTTGISFALSQTLIGTGSPEGVTTGDFNNDGRPDLAVVFWVGGRADIYLNNNGAIPSTATFQYAVGGNPGRIKAGDLNGDGLVDLAITDNRSTQSVSILLNQGAGVFASPQKYAVPDRPVGLRLGDLDNDGDLDLVTGANDSASVFTLLNQGNGTLIPGQTLAVTDLPLDVHLADFDADGQLDLAAVNTFSPATSVLYNQLGIQRVTVVAGQTVGGRDFGATFLNQAENPPVAVAGGPYTVRAGETLLLDGSDSSDPDHNIVSYEWDFDYDGSTFDVNATGVSPVFDASALTTLETRTIALRVTDASGLTDIAVTSLWIHGAAAPANISVSGWWPGNGTAEDIVGNKDGVLTNGVTYDD
ncbi:MAG: VCBS repeat-containing protein, partial [Planctomycetaceae bacterium]|nr:VCBS repeat-containing protein [Planctomycetaceae bacterium]